MPLPSDERAADLGTGLEPLYDPRSVALVGASATRGKWGHELSARLLRSRGRRRVHLVSRSARPVLGEPTVPSLTDVDGPVDLVVSAVGPDHLEDVVTAGLAAGARAFVAITGGLGELGGAGATRERALVDRLRAKQARLLGPNCLGVIDTSTGLTASAWFDRSAEVPGSVAVVTQSGTVGLDFQLLARRVGIGFSRFVSLGNQADISISDVLEDLVEHESTRLVVVYCEHFGNGRRLLSAVERLVATGRPVLVLAPGASDAAARAAKSHTGSLTSSRAVVAAACEAVGAVLLKSTDEVVDVAYALLRTSQTRGRRVGIVADGGGYGVVLADVLEAAGLSVPRLSATTQDRLRADLGPSAGTSNPVDIAAAAADPEALDRAVRITVESGDVDCVAITGFIGDPPPAVDVAPDEEHQTIVSATTAAAASRRGVPVVVQALFDGSSSIRRISELPVAVYRTSGSVARALAGSRRAAQAAAGLPAELPPAPAVVGAGYFAARALMSGAGVAFAPARSATDDPRTVVAAAEQLGYPVVLKTVDRLHKSDAGGVVLGIGDRDALVRAHRDLVSRLQSTQFAVEQMVARPGAHEVIVGATRDPQFGPIALVGLGGVLTEAVRDVQVRLAPLDHRTALAAVRSLRAVEVLTGARGRPAADLDAIAAALVAVARVAAEHPEISELEINPLLVSGDDATGLDARVLLADPSST